jgi:hypothetical protein
MSCTTYIYYNMHTYNSPKLSIWLSNYLDITRILSTTTPRWSGCTQFMEYSTPAVVLPLSKLVFNSCAREGHIFLFWVNMAALCHMTRNVNSWIQCGGFGHAQVLYKLTTCYRHMGRRDDNRVFSNWLGPSGSGSI